MYNDQELFKSIDKELKRQQTNIELIASENFVSNDVLRAAGSILTNKYAEGYIGKRYYGGCEYIDEVEQLAISRAKEIFKAEHANVQPHSGSQANMAVFLTVLDYNDKVLGMSLSEGGHLSHGHPLNFSGLSYEFHAYGVDQETHLIDYEEVLNKARQVKPKLIIAGASAYARKIDFKKFKEIADEVGAYLMVDIAHIAGLVAAGLHENPCLYADFVTSTTHKTLRGPRGGIVLCKKEFAKKLDRTVFPGIQGGPLMHIIAAKAVCFYEALQPEFITYQKQVIKNAQLFASELIKHNYRVITNGSDNHMFLLDVKTSLNINGLQAQEILEKVMITTNKNTIPYDSNSPSITSGLRIGTAAITTRGFIEEDIIELASIIVDTLNNYEDEVNLNKQSQRVVKLNNKYPIYESL